MRAPHVTELGLTFLLGDGREALEGLYNFILGCAHGDDVEESTLLLGNCMADAELGTINVKVRNGSRKLTFYSLERDGRAGRGRRCASARRSGARRRASATCGFL